MKFSEIFKFLCSKFFWKNILISFAILVAILVALFVSLRFVTRHGEEIPVPALTGLYTEEAKLMLEKLSLQAQVVDTVYVRGKNPGEVVEQTPAAGSTVKSGRQIYLTINSTKKKMMPLPDMTDVSFRQAKATLEALGFLVQINYVPSEFVGLVRGVSYQKKPIEAGTYLPDGALLTLSVGAEMGEEGEAKVPNLLNMTYLSAVQRIQASGFTLGSVSFHKTPQSGDDTDNYFVYKQSLAAGEWALQGKRIDLSLTKDLKEVQDEIQVPTSTEEEFF